MPEWRRAHMCSAKSFAGLLRTSNKYKLCPTKIALLGSESLFCHCHRNRTCGLHRNRHFFFFSANDVSLFLLCVVCWSWPPISGPRGVARVDVWRWSKTSICRVSLVAGIFLVVTIPFKRHHFKQPLHEKRGPLSLRKPNFDKSQWRLGRQRELFDLKIDPMRSRTSCTKKFVAFFREQRENWGTCSGLTGTCAWSPVFDPGLVDQDSR